MVAIRAISKSFCRLAREAGLSIKVTRNRVMEMRTRGFQVSEGSESFVRKSVSQLTVSILQAMMKKAGSLAVPAGQMTQACSDGELNRKPSGCGSGSSLSERCSRSCDHATRAVRWAAGFEKLLEDEEGVRCFTEFLKSEVSAENILFYQACEKFKSIPPSRVTELKSEACRIFQSFLTEDSPNAVNIDDSAQILQSDLQTPSPHMFDRAQEQIFKLMKMDSYRRFVLSPLYQRRLLEAPALSCNMEVMLTTRENGLNHSEREAHLLVCVRLGQEAELKADRKKKRLEKRGSWGEISTKSSSSLELTEPHTRAQVTAEMKKRVSIMKIHREQIKSVLVENLNGRCSLVVSTPEALSSGSPTADRYCCVFLPDGTASLAPARPGLSLRHMISGLCERRGFPLERTSLYLRGGDQPLGLELDSSGFGDQQLSLELKVTFHLELQGSGTTLRMEAQSSRSLEEVISGVLQSQQLSAPDVQLTLSGSKEAVSLSSSVFRLSGRTVHVERVGLKTQISSSSSSLKSSPRPRKQPDVAGLVELLSRAQCSRVDDQRGLLTPDQLELPSFLQLPQTRDEPEQDAAL
ncbi:hypothetical protein DNTS_014642 [Danionella cerebrum]|uniref:RGS domain-containing protein n=1 Tax=Danionella cerebrum TaxID=2873325 RepID=A0A553R8J9_9TELE|nr:hypothetical protein DNTS_014642 [Danionella translucida]